MSDMTNYVYKKPINTNEESGSVHEVTSTWMPARAFFFLLLSLLGKKGFSSEKFTALWMTHSCSRKIFQNIKR